eukprot:2063755-Amphidinium_carterae.1
MMMRRITWSRLLRNPDCVSAFLQAPQVEECYVAPPAEWLHLRRLQGLSTAVRWRLKKQLPGQRAAGVNWTEFAAEQMSRVGMERNDALPHFFRIPGERLALEIHMDDIHGVGKRSEVERLLPRLRKVLKLKASDAIVIGKYEHLKRTRLRHDEGVVVKPHDKHVSNIFAHLGLERANGAKTPCFDGEPEETDKELNEEKHRIYRACVGSALYLSSDRPDIQREVGILATRLGGPTDHDWRRLVKLGRYLKSTAGLGMKIDRTRISKHEPGVIGMDCYSDTDWASDKTTRRSVSCCMVFSDDILLASMVRRQSVVALTIKIKMITDRLKIFGK